MVRWCADKGDFATVFYASYLVLLSYLFTYFNYLFISLFAYLLTIILLTINFLSAVDH